MNECKNCLYYNVKESRCMNDYNRHTYLVILYRHNCETFLKLENIISNSTLSKDDEYYKAHNEHVIEDDMILCYMYKRNPKSAFANSIYKSDTVFDRIENTDGKIIEGDYCMHGNFIFGKDIPVDLAEELEITINKYRQKIEKEFKNLKDNYIEEDE